MNNILFFDGYCSLCNGLVDRLMKWDHHGRLKFASLQGETAKKLLPAQYLQAGDPDTVLYWRDGIIYERSTAILYCLSDTNRPWILILFVVPRFLRDLLYRLVAKIRYRVFGRRDTCRLPNAEEHERLLP